MRTPLNNGLLQSNLDCAGFKPLTADLSDYAGANLSWNTATKKFDALDPGAGAGSGAVDSVFGRTGTVVAATNDYTFAQIGSKPTTLSGYGITDAQPIDADLTAIAALSGTNTIYYRSAANTWTPVTIGGRMTFSGGTLDAVAGGGGTVTSIATTSPITGGTITGTGTLALDVSADFSFTHLQTITTGQIVSNASVNSLSLRTNRSDAVGGTGLGTAISFSAESSTTDNRQQAQFGTGWQDATDATRSAYFDFLLVNSATLASKMRLFPSGGLSVNSTTDPGAGYVNANTGFKVAGSALAFSNIAGTPTTLSGYGITDAQPLDSDLTAWASKTAPAGTAVGTTDTQTLTNKTIGDKLDLISVAQPATPSAGTIRLSGRTGLSGLDSLAYHNTLGIPIVLGRDVCAFVKNTSGATITKGSVVTINSSSASIPLVIKSLADAGMTKIPAAGMMVADIPNNTVGLMMITGTINNVNTSGVGAGNTLYVSPTTAGAFTDTKPSHPLVAQSVGECLNSNLTTGSILVNVTEANMGLLEGVNGSSWAVGDGTGSSAKSVLFKNSNTGTLQWNPTGSRILTLPDSTDTLAGISGTQTLTNKRINPRVTSIASNATWSPNADTDDFYEVTAQAAAATTISNPSGTPVDGQKLMFRIKDNGTARALTWSGSQWRASSDLALPTTTILSKTLYLGFIYNSADTKWDLLALLNNF